MTLVPVVAPRFLPFPISKSITPEQMREHVQCIIRDSARHSSPRDYYVVEGARSWTVSDQLMKKEVILQGMGWGHLPDYLIGDELDRGELLSIKGKHFGGAAQSWLRRDGATLPMGPWPSGSGVSLPRKPHCVDQRGARHSESHCHAALRPVVRVRHRNC